MIFIHLEQLVQIITEVLNKVHVAHFGQQQLLGLRREGNLREQIEGAHKQTLMFISLPHLGTGQPGPMIWVCSPGVWMFDGEGQTVVNGSHGYARLLTDLLLLSPLDILDQPVVIAPVRVPDDVVQHHQLLKLQLKHYLLQQKAFKMSRSPES